MSHHLGQITSVEVGQRAEQTAADFLAQQGYQVVERNFAIPKLCEIDIVATKAGELYFVEIKYRSTLIGGGGLDYITPRKLQHMRRAAQIWVRQHGFRQNYNLAAIEVSGPELLVSSFIESIY